MYGMLEIPHAIKTPFTPKGVKMIISENVFNVFSLSYLIYDVNILTQSTFGQEVTILFINWFLLGLNTVAKKQFLSVWTF